MVSGTLRIIPRSLGTVKRVFGTVKHLFGLRPEALEAVKKRPYPAALPAAFPQFLILILGDCHENCFGVRHRLVKFSALLRRGSSERSSRFETGSLAKK